MYKVIIVFLLATLCLLVTAKDTTKVNKQTNSASNPKLGKNSPNAEMKQEKNNDGISVIGNYYGDNNDDFVKPVMFRDDKEGNRYILDYIYGKIVAYNKDLKSIKFVINGLKNPSFFAFINEKIYVTESNENKIKIFDIKNGKKVDEFGKVGLKEVEFRHPSVVQEYKDEIYIIDDHNFRIQVLDKENNYLREIRLPTIDYLYTPSYSINYSLIFKGEKLYVLDSYSKKVYLYENKIKKQDDFELPFTKNPVLILSDAENIYLYDNFDMLLYKFDFEFYLREKYELAKKENIKKEFIYLVDGTILDNKFIFLKEGNINQYNMKEKKLSVLQNIISNKKSEYIHPIDIKTDKNGNLNILDLKLASLIKYNIKGEFVSKIEGLGYNPTGFCFDTDDNIYVAVAGENCVKKYNSSGKLIVTFGNYKEFPCNFDFYYESNKEENDKISLEDRYNLLTEKNKIYNMKVEVDPDGYIYVLNSKTMQVKVYDPFFSKKYEVGKKAGFVSAFKSAAEKGAFGWDGSQTNNLKQLRVENNKIWILDGFYKKIVYFENGKYNEEIVLSKYKSTNDFYRENDIFFISNYDEFKIKKTNSKQDIFSELNLLKYGYMPLCYYDGYAIIKKYGNNFESYNKVIKIDKKLFEGKVEEGKK